MKFKSSTLALLAIALLSVGGLYVWDRTQSEQAKTPKDSQSGTALFQFKEADVAQVSVQTKSQTLKLEKGAKSWQIVSPKPGLADEGTVTFLLNLLATGTSEKTLQVEPKQLGEFGLAQAIATIGITLKNQKSHQIVLGNQTFNQSAVYARVDPAVSANADQTVPIVVIPTGFLDAVNRPLSEWQAKPQPKATAAPK
jgi:hypothetical protein